MLFNKSTRSIVAGKKKPAPCESNAANTDCEEAGAAPIPEEPAEDSPTPAGAGSILMEKVKVVFTKHKLLIILISAVVAALVIGICIGAAIPQKSDVPEQPQLTPNEKNIVSLYVGEALAAATAPGDIVQLTDIRNEPIVPLLYVEVYKTSHDMLLLLLDDLQTENYLQEDIGGKVVLITHDDPERAAQLLDLQDRINAPVITLTVQDKLTIYAGESVELTFSTAIDPQQAILPEILWETSDASVLTVSDNGIVTAHSAGSAVIKATCGNVQASCYVTINTPLESIVLNKLAAEIAIEDSLELSLVPFPADAVFSAPVWTSSNPEIATVSQDGVVTPVAAGTVVISAAVGDLVAECTVTVGYHAEAVQLNCSELTLTVKDTYKLIALIYPNTNILDSTSFTSSKPEVAVVYEDGTVYAVSKGTTTITFTCGKASTTCVVTVVPPAENNPPESTTPTN